MAMCILGSGCVFSKDYLNNLELTEAQRYGLFSAAEELLIKEYPEIVWLTHTSEVGVERDSLREARNEFSIEELRARMKEIWDTVLNESGVMQNEVLKNRNRYNN